MGKIKNLVNQGVGVLKNVKTYWKKPKEGYYLSFKEAAAYCVGGMGVVGASVVPIYVTLSLGWYIAAALQISPMEIFYIGIIGSIIAILKAPLCSWLVDNTRSKYGKFRPYLIWMPIPLLLCMFAIGWIPNWFLEAGNRVGMLVSYTVIFQLLQFFFGLYNVAFLSLVQVISPSQKEKEMLMSAGSVVYSLGPSVVNFIFPLLANLLYATKAGGGDGMNVIGPYKWLLPLIMGICLALGYLTAFGTKERVVVSKQYVQKVGFFNGIKQTMGNRFFWITNLSLALGCFRLVGTTFVAIICAYQIDNSWAHSLFTTLMGSACLPGMIFAPLLIKKFGKKNLILFSNTLAIVLTAIMAFLCLAPGNASAYIMILFSFLITVANGVQVVVNPALGTQMYDYQQYKTGNRLEGFLAQFGGIIVTIIGFGTAYVLPFINETFGFTGDAEVFRDVAVIYPIIMWSCIAGVISGIIGTIPYLFWNINEKRHEDIIEILKVRAMKEDKVLDEAVADELEAKLENGEHDALREYDAEQARISRLVEPKFTYTAEAEELYNTTYNK